MGMTFTITYPNSAPPWNAIRDALADIALVAPIRMIDGMPAFPDEIPESGWKELRIGLPSGMVTLRRSAKGDECITWGNASPEMQRDWARLAYACAKAGDGQIDGQSLDQFAESRGLSS